MAGKAQGHPRRARVGFFIPFLFLFMHDVEYSPNALLYDHGKKCRSDGTGTAPRTS